MRSKEHTRCSSADSRRERYSNQLCWRQRLLSLLLIYSPRVRDRHNESLGQQTVLLNVHDMLICYCEPLDTFKRPKALYRL